MFGDTTEEPQPEIMDDKTDGGGAVVDLIHQGTVLRESENELIDQIAAATVRRKRKKSTPPFLLFFRFL